MHERVGLRALQQNASQVVKRATAGETIDITDRGRVVARIVPAGNGALEDARTAGLIREADRPVAQLAPALQPPPGMPTASEILASQREHER